MLLATCKFIYQRNSFLLAAGGRGETQHVLEERPEKSAGQWHVLRKQRFQIVERGVPLGLERGRSNSRFVLRMSPGRRKSGHCSPLLRTVSHLPNRGMVDACIGG